MFVGLSIGIGFGIVYGIDYNYHAAYGRFMGPHEYSMLIGEWDYWRGSITQLITPRELFSLVLYTLPFVILYTGIGDAVLEKLVPGTWQLPRLYAGAAGMVALGLTLAGLLKTVSYFDARPLHLPDYATFLACRISSPSRTSLLSAIKTRYSPFGPATRAQKSWMRASRTLFLCCSSR